MRGRDSWNGSGGRLDFGVRPDRSVDTQTCIDSAPDVFMLHENH